MWTRNNLIRCAGIALALIGAMWTTGAHAQVLAMSLERTAEPAFRAVLPAGGMPDTGASANVPARLHRQIVAYSSPETAGTIIVDTPDTYLYYVLGDGKAIRYGIGVGREGFTWSGVKTIERMSEWPDWIPPADMLRRQPYLPRYMAGGPGNPLGARAMYLSGTMYRIHGTNQPTTIGAGVERLHPHAE